VFSLLLGLAATLAYILGSLIAYRHFPGEFSPLHGNLLGQLGDRKLNPGGAGYYLTGCALSGILATAFFVSLGVWRRSGTRLQNRLLVLVQGLGVLGSFGLLMTAFYPQEYRAVHHVWSGLLFASFGVALLLSPFTLRRGHWDLGLIGLAVVSYAADAASFGLADTHWIEWVTVALFVAYTWLLGFKTVRAGS
jgi:hypothetical protein